MAQTVGDFIITRLHAWGVRRMFGYPGDGINGVFGALNRADEKIEFVQARHEEMAAFMASAYAKFSGELGVCIATSGPGATHLVTGMYDARADHQPLLAIVGQQARGAIGGHYQQEVDLAALFKDVAGDFVHQASTPAQVRHLIDCAIRIALAKRTVTALIDDPDRVIDRLEHIQGRVCRHVDAPPSKTIVNTSVQAIRLMSHGPDR
jgi:pyruvate dehydrogenase (quinone)